MRPPQFYLLNDNSTIMERPLSINNVVNKSLFNAEFKIVPV